MLLNAYLFTCKKRCRYSRKRATFCRNFAKNWQLPYGSAPTRRPNDPPWRAEARSTFTPGIRKASWPRQQRQIKDRLTNSNLDRTRRLSIHREGSGKLDRARSRLYRGQNLQESMRWKALAEIYTMHSFAPTVLYSQCFR